MRPVWLQVSARPVRPLIVAAPARTCPYTPHYSHPQHSLDMDTSRGIAVVEDWNVSNLSPSSRNNFIMNTMLPGQNVTPHHLTN